MSTSAPDALHLLAQDVAVLKRDYSGLHGDVTSIANKLDTLSAQVTASQKTNWPVIVSAALGILGFSGMLIGGGWTVVDLRNENTVLKSIMPLAVQNSTSTEERQALAERVDRLSSTMAELRENMAALAAKTTALETEQETQFAAHDDTINGNHAEVFRYLGMIMPKVFGADIPSFWHSPEIGRLNQSGE